MAAVATWNAPFTIPSIHRVSRPPTGRGTMSVPTTLAAAVRTSKAPTAAAIERPMSGTTMSSPDDRWLWRRYRDPACAAGIMVGITGGSSGTGGRRRAMPTRPWRDGLPGQEQAAPGVGEEVLVAFGAPAALAGQQLVELGGVRGPHDVGGFVEIHAQRGDRGEVGHEAAHVRRPAFGDLAPQRGQFRLGRRGLLDDAEYGGEAAGDHPHRRGVDCDLGSGVGSGLDRPHVVAFLGGDGLAAAGDRGLDEEAGQLGPCGG